MTSPAARPLARASVALVLACAAACSAAPAPPDPQVLVLRVADAPPVELVRIAGHGAVGPFWIARTELTAAQYAAFVRATGYDGGDHPSSKPSEPFLAGWSGAAPPAGRADHPVCNVNVHHARAWCDWASRVTGRRVRLPGDAEWELAARGPEGRTYPWGAAWDPTRCNWGDADAAGRFGAVDGYADAAPVGAFPRGATPEGVLDLAGNAWEWTAEAHLRGGPWCMGPETLESALVAREDPERADDKFGFRVVVDP